MMIPVALILFGSLFIYSAIKGEKNPLNIVRGALQDSGIVNKQPTGPADDWQA